MREDAVRRHATIKGSGQAARGRSGRTRRWSASGSLTARGQARLRRRAVPVGLLRCLAANRTVAA
jgi:hypothetical protein